MCVGEAPGEREDAAATPWVGQAGKLLRSTLAELGCDMTRVYFTNAVRCHPEDNRDPTDEEIENCRSWLELEIDEIKPRVILALGKKSQAALKGLDISIPVHVAYHPAYILRSRRKTDDWKGQLQAAVWASQGMVLPPPPEPAPWQEVRPGTEVAMDPNWLAADTETDDLEEGIGVKLVSHQWSDGNVATFNRGKYFLRSNRVFLHNAKYDIPLLGINARDLSSWDDTALMAYVLRYDRVGLKELGPLLTGIEMEPIKDMLTREIVTERVLKSGPNKGQIKRTVKKVKQSFSEALAAEPARAKTYAMKDAVVTSRLARILEPQLRAIPKLWNYYQSIEKPTLPILMEMEQRGALIDADALTPLAADLDEQITQLKSEICEMFPGLENPASNDELADALTRAGYKLTKTTETGKLSVDEQVLLRLMGVNDKKDVPASWPIGKILAYREARKLKSTYVDRLLADRDSNGRVHARFNQMVTATNRLSSSGPNFQNIPAHGSIKKGIRRAFIARPGYTIVKADYSQLEVRLFAHYMQEPVLLAAYPWDGPSRDVHQGVADEIRIVRSTAKNVLFAGIYGAAGPKLAQTAGVPVSEAGPFLESLRTGMPSLLEWPRRIEQELASQGYVETWLGWRNYYPLYWSPIRKEQREALREAGNMPIQGTGAGLVKQLMIEVDKIAPDYGSELILQVHDEVVYETPTDLAPLFARKLRELGRAVGILAGITVPLSLEVEVGPNWADLSPFEIEVTK